MIDAKIGLIIIYKSQSVVICYQSLIRAHHQFLESFQENFSGGLSATQYNGNALFEVPKMQMSTNLPYHLPPGP